MFRQSVELKSKIATHVHDLALRMLQAIVIDDLCIDVVLMQVVDGEEVIGIDIYPRLHQTSLLGNMLRQGIPQLQRAGPEISYIMHPESRLYTVVAVTIAWVISVSRVFARYPFTIDVERICTVPPVLEYRIQVAIALECPAGFPVLIPGIACRS